MCSLWLRGCSARTVAYKGCVRNFHSNAQPRSYQWKRYIFLGTGVLLPVGYYFTLDSVSRRNVRITIEGTGRFLRSVKIGTIISLDYWWKLYGLQEESSDYQREIKNCHQRAADRILEGCLKNGGLYIKLGQSLVALNHILPKEYLDTLEVLHDQALVRKQHELEEIFEEEFGAVPQEIFAEFNEKPIAAASLAQVFTGKTHEGEKVAVKVQYIDLQQRFHGDVLTLSLLVKLASWMHPNFNFSWILDYLKECLVTELDFINEGRNMERCSADLKHLHYVYIPKVHWEKTSKRILTMEFIDGAKVNDIQGIRNLGLSLADVDRKMILTFSEQIFHTGFVHADPHPGNIIIRRNTDGKAQIVLIDHGLYEYLPEQNRLSLGHLWKSIVLNDDEAMKKYCSELGVNKYRVFCEILMQRPLQRMTFRINNFMSQEETNYMKEMAQKHFDDIMDCLRGLPKPMLLIFRNINTVRSITKVHGHPVDRFTIMARSATRGVFKKNNKRVLEMFSCWWNETMFNLRLWFEIICMRFGSLYMRILMMTSKSKDVAYFSELMQGEFLPS